MCLFVTVLWDSILCDNVWTLQTQIVGSYGSHDLTGAVSGSLGDCLGNIVEDAAQDRLVIVDTSVDVLLRLCEEHLRVLCGRS